MLLSPSKTLDETPVAPPYPVSVPEFLDDTMELHSIMKRLSADKIKELMKVSDKIAELNRARYQMHRTPFTEANAKAALFMFKGDVYDAMPVGEYTRDDLAFATQHLRMLSGYYGLLRPCDLIQPYRLEMGTKLPNKRGKDLYVFWEDKISEAINQATKKQSSPLVVNLASEEYFKAVKPKLLNAPLVNAQFRDEKGGEYKIIGFFAKRARGMMADYIIRNRITSLDDMRGFDVAGYRYDKSSSDDQTMTFLRDEKAAKAA